MSTQNLSNAEAKKPALPYAEKSIDRGIVQSGERWKTPLVIGTCTLGQVRFEWAAAIQHMVIPVNLSMANMVQPYSFISPMRYHVAEGQNIIVRDFLNTDSEWLLLLEDDVVPPPNVLLQFAKWMNLNKYPVVSGWYNVKAVPSIPMFFRGRGNGPVFGNPSEVVGETIDENYKLEGVMCDGVPTGCLLIHRNILQVCADNSPTITLTRVASSTGDIVQFQCKEVFVTQREAGIDPETGGYYKRLGTSDLEFCDRLIANKWFSAAGYPHLDGVEWPFPVDINIKCGHIDLTTGVVY